MRSVCRAPARHSTAGGESLLLRSKLTATGPSRWNSLACVGSSPPGDSLPLGSPRRRSPLRRREQPDAGAARLLGRWFERASVGRRLQVVLQHPPGNLVAGWEPDLGETLG